MTNHLNIIYSPKKQILENQNLEPVPSTSCAIYCQSLPTSQDEIITCFESLPISYSNDPSMWIIIYK